MSVTALREMVMLPENRPAMRLLLRSTMAMASVPIAVYYFFFHQVLGPQGWYDMSDDLNWRINYSGFASLAAVQVRRAALSSLSLLASLPPCLSFSRARAGGGVPFRAADSSCGVGASGCNRLSRGGSVPAGRRGRCAGSRNKGRAQGRQGSQVCGACGPMRARVPACATVRR
jgi:hypothetical protein